MVNIGPLLSRPSRHVRRTAATAVPAAVMLLLGLWGVDRGGMWRDEAVTFQVARRTVPQIWRLLHEVDAVHGLYYLVMHAVLAVGPGEVVLRLPSVCAAALTAGLVGALGTRLARPRVGLWAGLLYALTPMAGHYAQEGRSYALVAAGAAGATLLLVRAVAEGGGRSWWAYGAVLGLTCLLHELAVLLLLAHAVTLALTRVPARVWRGWAGAAGAVGLALLPMVAVSHGQSAQLAWVRSPDWGSAGNLLRAFVGPAPGVYWPCLALAVAGLTGLIGSGGSAEPGGPGGLGGLGGRGVPGGGRGRPTCAAVAAPLAVLPPAILMLVSQEAPLYVDRYVLYALAGAPLLVAAGADRVLTALAHRRPSPEQPRPAGRARRAEHVGRAARPMAPGALVLGTVLAVGAVFVQQLPLLRADRSVGHRPDNLAAVSSVAARELRPGDPVLFLPSHARATALAYPGAFHGTRDVALAARAPASGTLYGTEVDPEVLRRRLAGLDRVWVVAERHAVLPPGPRDPGERLKLDVVNEEFALSEQSARDRVLVRLYVRRALVTDDPLLPAGPPRPAPS
ncbi:glycosyltransferase family 39 protein [Streptomyces sp. NPDC026672]|uniref:glycosyltransferase family 39 protein n=1 Tax=unclassified Streptomyces TaxID=2593676 RepID=UPI0033C9F434